ncbi:ABC transporter permease [Candidatus Pacearchaeota archaeon]|nr:ABC transporter permease [Candidatus Pacearchaeota archaeon]
MKSSFFKIALKTLWKRRLRSSLTMLGIIIAIATIFVLISVSMGLQIAVTEQFRALGTDKFFIFSRAQIAGPGSGGSNLLTLEDIKVIDKVPGVKDLSYVAAGNAKIEFGGETRYLQIIGVPTNRGDVFIESGAYKIEEGRWLREGDRRFVGLGSHFSRALVFTEEVHEGDSIIINGVSFKVKASMRPVGNPVDDRILLIPLEDFQEIFNSDDRIDQIIVQAESSSQLREVASGVEKKLRSSRSQTEKTQDFTVLTPEEFLATFDTILGILTSFLLGVAAISIIVGGIGIATTMYTSVLERTKEIGTMKAVGAKNSDILFIFLIESGLLGFIGGIFGMLLGYGIAKSIEYVATQKLNTTLLQAAAPIELIIGCLTFAFLIGAVSGVFPAWRASKLNTVTALRYE